MQERIIILGAGVMQGPAIRIAKELGLFTVVADGSSSAPCIPMADKFERIDLKDKEGIEALARSLQNNGGLAGIMTAGTDFSATVAWVAEKLGLPGIPYEAALNASDKARMRGCFKRAGLPSPEFISITESELQGEPPLPCPRRTRPPEGVLSSSKTVDCSCAGNSRINPSTPLDGAPFLFPLVVKPVDNMGGRGCRRVDNIEEYREAAAEAIRFSRSGRAIVEAFMDGPEFSVDAIVYHGEITICGLADRHIFFPPYFIEMGHTMPTAVAPEQQEALLETFCAGVRALGLAGGTSAGAAKGDIKLTPSGPMIGEIAARLSGGYMSGWTYPYSSGVEPVRAAILAAVGRKPDGLVPLKTWTSAERAFISIPGTVKSISGIETARRRPFVKDLFFRIAEGDRVDFPRNNVSKCGNIISAAPEHDSAAEAAESAARSILIRLDPSDPETGEFLSSPGTGFPPDAYPLGPELKAALAALPDTKIRERKSDGSSSPIHWDSLQIIPFPAFEASGLKDYAGRGVAESLQAVRELSGLKLPEFHAENAVNPSESSDNRRNSFLGRQFWSALARGGYQGAVYYVEQLEMSSEQ